jgi:hypothetical protein
MNIISTTAQPMSKTRAYRIWLGIRRRCSDDLNARYGGRGIKVCNRWADSFEAFYADMGEPPSRDHSIDRIDNDGNYEPSNCRWATRTEQSRNTHTNTILSFDGRYQTIAAWAEETGIKPPTICVRIYVLGWPIERALTEKPQPRTGEKPWIEVGMSRSSWYRAGRPTP